MCHGDKSDKRVLFHRTGSISSDKPRWIGFLIMNARLTTHLENLEKSGNSKVVREKSGKMEKSQGKVRGNEIRYVFSSSKYPKTRFSAGAPPRTPLRELMTLPQAL